MANLKIKDADGNIKYLKKNGLGTDLDPHTDPATILGASSEKIGEVSFTPASAIAPLYLKVVSATGTNDTLVQAGVSNLAILHIVSTAATPRYFKLYNKATAPVSGTDVPLIVIALATGASNFTLPALVGIDFSLGLSFAITLGVSDTDSTPFTVVGEVVAMLSYT